MTATITVANEREVAAVVGTPFMIREDWGIRIATRRNVFNDMTTNEGWSPVEMRTPSFAAIGEDVIRMIAAAMEHAASFDLVSVARSLAQLGLLKP
jgi:hypothetical protein